MSKREGSDDGGEFGENVEIGKFDEIRQSSRVVIACISGHKWRPGNWYFACGGFSLFFCSLKVLQVKISILFKEF